MSKERLFRHESNENKIVFKGAKISRGPREGENWFLTQKDIRNGEKFYNEEKVSSLDNIEIFQKGVESILSRAEKFVKQKRLFKILLENNLDTPQNITDNVDKLKNLFEKSNYKPVFPTGAVKNILGFSNWWSNSDLPREIVGAKERNDLKRGIEFRDRIAKLGSSDKAPGMGPKIASLFISLCGFKNVVIIDQNICYFLKDNGHFPWRVPDRKYGGGLYLSRYKELEKIMSDMASKYDASPEIFQLSLFNKYREQNNKNKNKRKSNHVTIPAHG